MALIKCPECGREISDKAENCPGCGAPMKLKNKKFCQYCGRQIDADCVICPECGKQVAALRRSNERIVINNAPSAAASSSAASSSSVTVKRHRYPWHLTFGGIFILGLFTGGIYWIIGLIWRILY